MLCCVLFTAVSPSGCRCVHILVAKLTYKQNLKYRKTVVKYDLSQANSYLNFQLLFNVVWQIEGI